MNTLTPDPLSTLDLLRDLTTRRARAHRRDALVAIVAALLAAVLAAGFINPLLNGSTEMRWAAAAIAAALLCGGLLATAGAHAASARAEGRVVAMAAALHTVTTPVMTVPPSDAGA